MVNGWEFNKNIIHVKKEIVLKTILSQKKIGQSSKVFLHFSKSMSYYDKYLQIHFL